MAFISAVLMLFLSVVLMLPISTLTSKNVSNTSKISSFVILSQFSQESELLTLPIETALVSGFVTLYFIYLLLTKLYLQNKNVYLKQFEVFEFSHNPLMLRLVNVLYSSHVSKNYFGQIYEFLITIVVIVTNEVKLLYLQTRSFFFIMTQFLLKTIIIPATMFKVFVDVAVQTYLFSSVFLSLSISFISKQLMFNIKAAELNIEIVQGIGQLKTLLYGNFSLFLIFSTIVLLVALLGAAVMTRSKR
jgi:NADH:ubiquinone oxidoreductase subunit 6 (subunit J)